MKKLIMGLVFGFLSMGAYTSAEANAPACQGTLAYTTVIYPAYCQTEEYGPHGMYTCTKRAIKTKSYTCNGTYVAQDVDYFYPVESEIGSGCGNSMPNCAQQY